MKSNREIRAEAKATREQVALDKKAEAILDRAALDLFKQVQQLIVQQNTSCNRISNTNTRCRNFTG